VSRAFGDFFFKQPAPLVTSQPYTITTHINTERDDSILILGSDGVRNIPKCSTLGLLHPNAPIY
jgi:serine/threonine protein phosphatase PrpC